VAFDATRAAFSNSKIFLVGDCLGGLRIVNWLKRRPDMIPLVGGLVLESPLPHLNYFSNIICQCRQCKCGATTLHRLISMCLPNYHDTQTQDELKDELTIAVPHALIGLIADDPISPASLQDTYRRLFPNNLTIFICNESLFHGNLIHHQPFQKTVRLALV
jgi:hypothetical protein